MMNNMSNMMGMMGGRQGMGMMRGPADTGGASPPAAAPER
jgi:hypothetical protein